MTARSAYANDDPNSVRKVSMVAAPPAVAWRVFTERMGTWWPLAVYKIGKTNAVDAVIEPRVGGRWYERGDDGSTCDWGRVLVWEPPSRLVLSWDVSADWQYDPELKTEIEIRFIAATEGGTRVELEHRKLDRYGARRAEMRRIFDVEGDWAVCLRCSRPEPSPKERAHDGCRSRSTEAVPVSAHVRHPEPQPLLLQARDVVAYRPAPL